MLRYVNSTVASFLDSCTHDQRLRAVLVDCCEVSSPMTHTRFTGSTGGTSYGIALNPKQFLFRRLGPETEVGGLYICGANSVAGHGIPGAIWSGVLAALRVVGDQVLKSVMTSPV